ncbi:hypothetical protein, partial [uncultured Brevundimonas sp.]|uniref:hypothetical protein n=1 Tax=uncultured Brevundimonas sp. TaxID=213418 RepID=UPI0032B1729A
SLKVNLEYSLASQEKNRPTHFRHGSVMQAVPQYRADDEVRAATPLSSAQGASPKVNSDRLGASEIA